MPRTIVITEEQLKQIEEAIFDNGLDSLNTIPQYIGSQVTTSGKENDEDFADPITSGELAGKMSKSFPWGTGAYYRGTTVPAINEDGQGAVSDMYNNTDQTGDGVKDMFNHADANELNDGDETDDQQIIPYSVERHLDRLIDSIKQMKLTPKKQINVLNKLVDNLDIKTLPPSYKKETSMKIFAKNRR